MHSFVFVFDFGDVFDFDVWVVRSQLAVGLTGLQQVLAHAGFEVRIGSLLPVAVDGE